MTNANDNFGNSNGSENFYNSSLPFRGQGFLYTDGVKSMAETCGAYWLIDLVVSYQGTREINLQRFQVWELKRKKDCKFSVLATDGNDNRIASQQIPFSDFPFDAATLWLVDGCLMLPTEY